MVIAIPIGARAQPAPEPAGEIEMKNGCEHEPTCVAEEFADALATQPADPHALRFDSLITFEPGRARVYSSGREKIEALARSWRAHAQWAMITVEGYAGPGGKVVLAEQRADRIRGYLVRYGVPAEYVVAIASDNIRGGTAAKRPVGGRVDLAIALCASTPEDCRIKRLPSAPVSIAK